MIPRIIHQTWKSSDLPDRYRTLAGSWTRSHPRWQWRLWTDADNLRLVEQEFPELLALYQSYPYPIQRIDMIRYLILYRFGGLYVDLDFECFKPVDPLLSGQTCVLSLEASAHNSVHGTRRIVSNAFMAAVPEHPLFAAVIKDLQSHRSRQTQPDRIVLDTTGPMMLTRVVDRFGSSPGIQVLPAEHLFPLSLTEADALATAEPGAVADPEVHGRLNVAYGVHWHDGGWWRTRPAAVPAQRQPARRFRQWLAALRGAR